MAANFPCMLPCGNISCCSTKFYPFLQWLINGSSMAHQWLINGSSMAHQWLINCSSSLLAHLLFWLIFFWLFSARPKSPRVIPRALCGLCLVLHECVFYSVWYILRQAPSCPTPRRLLLLHSTVHRLTVAKLGTRRLRGGNGFGNGLGRTSRNACNVMSTCCEKS
jgi:hypothetical protein